MARQKETPLESMILIAGKMPWWMCLLLAVVSYVLLHLIASLGFRPISQEHMAAGFLVTILKVFAMAGQYIVPLMLICAAGVSVYNSVKNKPTSDISAQSITPSCPQCGRTMMKRLARQGSHAGKEFWGCTDYPKCNGTFDRLE